MKIQVLGATCLLAVVGSWCFAQVSHSVIRFEEGKYIIERNGQKEDLRPSPPRKPVMSEIKGDLDSPGFRLVPQEVTTLNGTTTTRGMIVNDNGTTSTYEESETIIKSSGRKPIPNS